MLLTAHDIVRVGDAAHILHGTIFVIWTHHVINLAEWISGAEVLLIEVKSGLCDSKDLLVSEVVDQGLSDKDSLRNIHGVEILKDSVWSSTDGIQVSGYLRGLLELIDNHIIVLSVEIEEPVNLVALDHMLSLLFVEVVESLLDSVGDCSPVRWANHDEAHFSLEVWLIETWEHSEAVESFELRVKILALIF